MQFISQKNPFKDIPNDWYLWNKTKQTACTYVPLSSANRKTNLCQFLHRPPHQLRESPQHKYDPANLNPWPTGTPNSKTWTDYWRKNFDVQKNALNFYGIKQEYMIYQISSMHCITLSRDEKKSFPALETLHKGSHSKSLCLYHFLPIKKKLKSYCSWKTRTRFLSHIAES